jgi:hypothetical protein
MLAPPRPPSPDELEALIKEARARQLRRRLLGAAGVAIAAAFGLSAYAITIGVNPGDLVQSPASAGPVTAPICRASQLSAEADWQGATQSMLGGATVTNRGGVCSLPAGVPSARITWQGRALPLRERKVPNFGPGKPRRILEPGAKATVYIQWWNYCGRPVAAKLPPTLDLRFGTRLLVAAKASLNWGVPVCNARGPSTLFVGGPRA